MVDTPKRKVPVGACRELLKRVTEMQEHLTGLLADYDAPAGEDDRSRGNPATGRKPAKDDSDAGTAYAGDSARSGRTIRVNDIETRKAFAAGTPVDSASDLKIDYERLHR
jgi:hypothetical protein